MKHRIGMWASAGFLVAGCWALYALARPTLIGSTKPIAILVRLTCPIALLSFYPLRLYWILLANAAAYALVGLLLETLWQKLHFAK